MQSCMRRDGIDFVLFCSEPNYRYLTGHYTETWLNPARPMAVWVPLEGAPLAVICESERQWFGQTSWLSDAWSYDGMTAGPARSLGAYEIGFEPKIAPAIAAAGRSIGVSTGSRIGREFGSRTRMDLSQQVIAELEEALRDVGWVDAAPLIWEVRAIKSPDEVKYIKAATHALDEAFVDLFRGVPAGISERQIAQRLKAGVLRSGADRPGYVNVVSDVGQFPVFSAPTDRLLADGNLMYIDGGSVCRGYWADFCRMMAIGHAKDEHKQAYRISNQAMDAAIAAARPGNRARDIAEAVQKVVEAAIGTSSNSIGRVGHGVGLEMPEPPSLHLQDESILQPGMVLCLEPNFLMPSVGFIVAEEQVEITSEGCRLLSTRASGELPIL